MAYIKQEPLEGDEDFYNERLSSNRSFKRVTSSSFNPRLERSISPIDNGGGYLAKRSLAVQKSEQIGAENGLHGSTFKTTGFVYGGGSIVEVSHMLLDTGAASVFISSAAAKAARLAIVKGSPTEFILADGSTVYHSQFVTFALFIAGVVYNIMAYVEEHHTGHHILIGTSGLQQFQAQANLTFGRKQETRWSIAKNQTGLHRTRYVLQEDSAMIPPTMYVHNFSEGLRLAKSAGETSSQRKSREILERHQSRGYRIRERHEHRAGPLYKRRARKTFEDYFD